MPDLLRPTGSHGNWRSRTWQRDRTRYGLHKKKAQTQKEVVVVTEAAADGVTQSYLCFCMLVNQKLFIIQLLLSKLEPSLNCSHGILSFWTQAAVTTVCSARWCAHLFQRRVKRSGRWMAVGQVIHSKLLRKMNNGNVKYSEAMETKWWHISKVSRGFSAWTTTRIVWFTTKLR